MLSRQMTDQFIYSSSLCAVCSFLDLFGLRFALFSTIYDDAVLTGTLLPEALLLVLWSIMESWTAGHYAVSLQMTTLNSSVFMS